MFEQFCATSKQRNLSDSATLNMSPDLLASNGKAQEFCYLQTVKQNSLALPSCLETTSATACLKDSSHE